jgi:hypothetical protein
MVGSVASEQPLKRTRESSEITERLKGFKTELESYRTAKGIPGDEPTFLKYPLSALMIPELAAVFEIRLVYVLRPLGDIEATRLRRRWPEIYGAPGAKIIYSKMFQCLIDYSLPTLILRYPDVVRAPLEYAHKLATFSGLATVSEKLLEASAAAIRSAQTTIG